MIASIAGFALVAVGSRESGKMVIDRTPAWLVPWVGGGAAILGASLPGLLHWLILRR